MFISIRRSLRVQLKYTGIKVFELLAPAPKTPLNDKFTDLDGAADSGTMEPGKVVDTAIKELKDDKLEIYSGIARILLIFSRIAQGFIFKYLSGICAKKNSRTSTLPCS